MSSSSISTGSVAPGSGSASGNTKGGGNANKMTFGFFDNFDNEKLDDQMEVGSAIDQSATDITETKKDGTMSNENEKKKSIVNEVDLRSFIPERNIEYSLKNSSENDDLENDNEVIIIPVKIMSLQDIINNARKFCREKYVHNELKYFSPLQLFSKCYSFYLIWFVFTNLTSGYFLFYLYLVFLLLGKNLSYLRIGERTETN